jgi:hypothetical protein
MRTDGLIPRIFEALRHNSRLSVCGGAILGDLEPRENEYQADDKKQPIPHRLP